ncbi:MAG: MlaD family protein [Gordonia sp. (in: high G+C Gram-positive bacteria)]|uniref:MlaD family protein n=1 Tax=Gordonia sp. (in: high G+C Gram-positive bacteria) TaxID=84139 RepID=UPI003BB7BCD0
MSDQQNNPTAPDREVDATAEIDVTALPPKKSRRFAGKRTAKSVGILGLAAIVMISLATFYLKDLPLIGAAPQYTVQFHEAAGVTPGNEVRVAGVRVGEVTDVRLDGNRVLMRMRVADTWIGDETQATIQIKTVLGQKYIALNPKGTNRADPREILTDTVEPYDVVQAFSDAADQIENVDTNQVAKALGELSDVFTASADDIGPSLEGISRLSQTIASRDKEIRRLLKATRDSSKILADRNQQFTRLIAGTGVLLQELNTRQESISALLSSTEAMSTALTGIVKDNEKQIGPVLTSLKQVTNILTAQNENVRNSIINLAPFYRLYANVLGNGRWFESVVTNLIPPALPAQNTHRPPNATANLNNGGTEK